MNLTASALFLNESVRTDLLPKLDSLFSELALADKPGLGFGLFVLDEPDADDASLVPWYGQPLSAVKRVECWVEAGNQYIYSERVGDAWSFPTLGEHPHKKESPVRCDEVVDDLAQLAATFDREGTDPKDLHPAIRFLVFPKIDCKHVFVRFMRGRGSDDDYEECVLGPFKWVETRYAEMVAEPIHEDEHHIIAVDGPKHGQWDIHEGARGWSGSILGSWTDYCIYPGEKT